MGYASYLEKYEIIRVTPTLSTDAYAVGDVFFVGTEIPNAVREDGGCSKLINMFVLDQSDVQDTSLLFVYSEGNTALGTINATADISDANIEGLNIIGINNLVATQADTDSKIDTSIIHQVLPPTLTGESSFQPMLLQAASGSSSVYVQAILTSSTTPTYAADDIDLIFHIEK